MYIQRCNAHFIDIWIAYNIDMIVLCSCYNLTDQLGTLLYKPFKDSKHVQVTLALSELQIDNSNSESVILLYR